MSKINETSFDEKFLKDYKKFIFFLLIMATFILSIYSFKIVHILKPELYDLKSLNQLKYLFITLLVIIPLFIYLLTKFTFTFTLNYNIIFHTTKDEIIKPSKHLPQMKTICKLKLIFLNRMIVMRC